MYNIPILDKSLSSITMMGAQQNNRLREFNNIYRVNLNDELIKPLSYFNPVGVPITTINVTGMENVPMDSVRKYLYNNNADPSEEQQFTDAERLQYVQNVFNIQPPLSQKEKQIAPYLNLPYSPEFRDELVQESIKQNTNVFFTEAQDFVLEYQQSVNNMTNEENMYEPSSNSTVVLSNLLKDQIKLQTVNNMLLEKQMKDYTGKSNRYKTKMANQ
jgi:hypothetical protein